MNTETFESRFGSMITAKVDVNKVSTRKQAWEAYFNLMLETPILLKFMPENEAVKLTMTTVFQNVDWVS